MDDSKQIQKQQRTSWLIVAILFSVTSIVMGVFAFSNKSYTKIESGPYKLIGWTAMPATDEGILFFINLHLSRIDHYSTICVVPTDLNSTNQDSAHILGLAERAYPADTAYFAQIIDPLIVDPMISPSRGGIFLCSFETNPSPDIIIRPFVWNPLAIATVVVGSFALILFAYACCGIKQQRELAKPVNAEPLLAAV
jgi:hypothetical protein